MDILKERIIQKLKNKKMSMRQLSKKIGRSEDYISSFLRKVEGSNTTTLVDIATALDCSVNDLIYEKDNIYLISNNPSPINIKILDECAAGVTKWYRTNNIKLTDYNLWLSQVTTVYNAFMEEKLQELPDSIVSILLKERNN